MISKHRSLKFGIAIIAALLCLAVWPSRIMADTTDTATYGGGKYGNCDYGTCPITLTSSGAISLNVTPTQTGACTIQGDTVSVLTDNGAGYTLQVANSFTDTAMLNGGNTIPASSGTFASPSTLNANGWGYRLDGAGGFGAGPTTAQSSISAPISGFAGVPASNAAPTTLVTTSVAANPAASSTVWYGLCINTAVAAGTYTTQVTYTATTN